MRLTFDTIFRNLAPNGPQKSTFHQVSFKNNYQTFNNVRTTFACWNFKDNPPLKLINTLLTFLDEPFWDHSVQPEGWCFFVEKVLQLLFFLKLFGVHQG